MILTPIPRERLAAALDRFAARLDAGLARRLFAAIRATSPNRATDRCAAAHRCQTLAMARRLGMGVHEPGGTRPFNWDGSAVSGDTEAYVILHEIAHFVLAPPHRRALVDFGLGAGPDTRDRAAAEQQAALPLLAREADEAAASLLGIIWEAALGQPALASFLDQNWLEGIDRSGPAHFIGVCRALERRGLIDYALWLACEANGSLGFTRSV